MSHTVLKKMVIVREVWNVGYYDFVIIGAGKFWFLEDDWKLELGHWWIIQRTI